MRKPALRMAALLRERRRALRNRFYRLLYRPDWRRLSTLRGAFAGQRAFVVASGPSVATMDLGALAGEFVVVVNAGIRAVGELVPAAAMHVCLDNNRYRRFAAEFEAAAKAHEIPWRVYSWRVRSYWRRLNERGARPHFLLVHPASFRERGYVGDFSAGISPGSNVVIAVCQILCFLGFSEVYVLGVDLDYGRSEGKYFYAMGALDEVHEDDAKVQARRRDMERANEDFRLVAEALAPHGTRIVNAGVGGRLDSIPRADFIGLFST